VDAKQDEDERPRPKALGYIRVSAVGGRSGAAYHTKDVQRAAIEHVCRARDYELLDVLEEENRSGASKRRPVFDTVMERVLSGEADAVVVWKLSRFSRNWARAADDVQRLNDANKVLLTSEGDFDTDRKSGKLVMGMLLLLAEYERDVMNDEWEVIKQRVVRERGATLGHAGLGYRSGDGGRLERDPETAPLVVEMFERRARGATIPELVRLLNTRHPREHSPHGARDVRRILSRRAYIGEASWKETVVADAHEPLVAHELFDKVQTTWADDLKRTSRSKTRDFPLTGVLRCGVCGGPMSGSMDRARGEPRPNYKCSRRSKAARQGCSQPQSISAEPAELYVITAMDEAMRGTGAKRITETAATDIDQLSKDVATAADNLTWISQNAHQFRDSWRDAMLGAQKALDRTSAELDSARRAAGLSSQITDWNELPDDERWSAFRRAADLVVVHRREKGDRPADRLEIRWHHGSVGDAASS